MALLKLLWLLIVIAYDEVVYLPHRIRRWWWYRKRPEMKRLADAMTTTILKAYDESKKRR